MNQFQLDEEAIFDFARRIDSPELRAEYVAQACGTNGELKNRIAELLTAYDQEQSFLEQPPAEFAPTVTGAVSEKPGDTIGPYKLLQQIGEGGFGVVYMAEQFKPVKRKVALKIIKPGMDTKDVVARFEAERQALALMDHPNIAKVFDGGATDTGRPYFVMELVKGVPITEFCDSNRLSTGERLKLFGQVCQAIQHAHQKGVIHRDIKPSNVMVTLHDNQPVPKVIDFGVAKAISQELTEKTMFTTYGQMIGTPQYMSPEQAQMSGLDIDTRSDVYSLGVLLYELLTGTTPLDIDQLRNTAYAELQRLICESEPPKPSTKVTSLGEQSIQIASNRGVDARKLNAMLRGDLDWIVMKALEKDRNRRFDSVGNFADDIARYLADQPILARPPSTMYQLRKLVRRNRNRIIASAAAMISIALVVITIQKGWERDELYQELQQMTQQHAVDDALEALQNADVDELSSKIDLAEAADAAERYPMLMYILQGRLALEAENWEEAERLFRLAADENPESVSPQANLVLAYAYSHQVDKSLDRTKKLGDYQALTFYDYLFKAEAQQLGSWGEYSGALQTIQKSIDLKRDCKAAYIVQARLLVSQANVTGNEEGEFEQALHIIDHIEPFVRDQETIVGLKFLTHVEAAHTFRFLEEFEKAETHYQLAKDLLGHNEFLSEPKTRDLSYVLFLEYERANDPDDLEFDKKIFQHWKRLVFDRNGVGGVAGMYGMCAIPQGRAALDEALQRLEAIKNPSPDLLCQMGLIYIHANQLDRARETLDKLNRSETASPLVRHNAQWIALLLGDRESVDRCCEELESEYERMSRWEQLEWDILSGHVNDGQEVLKRAGADRRIASDGLLTLAMMKWPEDREQAVELLEIVEQKNVPYFALYTAKAVLYELRKNPDWQPARSRADVRASGGAHRETEARAGSNGCLVAVEIEHLHEQPSAE